MNTVGELKEFIRDLDDNMPIVKHSNNFELRGAIVSGIYPMVKKFRAERREFMDGFDHETYYHDIYVRDENGKECLQIIN